MASAKKTDRYVILHGHVGSGIGGVAAARGDVVEAAKLVPDKDGNVDQGRLQRLIDLGAVAPESSNEAQTAQAEVAPPEQQG